MKTLIRIIGYLVGGLILIGVLFGVAVLVFFDPNDYREQIEEIVAQETGRTLTIEGDIGLAVFPCCSVELNRTVLSNPPGFGEDVFFSIDAAAVSLKLWPLIVDQQIEIGTVELSGLQINLVQRADGATNWEFSSGPAEPETDTSESAAGMPALSVDGIQFDQGRISWQDEAAGTSYLVDEINVQTGAIVEGQGFDLNASCRVSGLAPDVMLLVNLDSRVEFDPEVSTVELQNLQTDLRLNGPGVPADRATLTLTTDKLAAGGPANQVEISGLVVALDWAGLTARIGGDGVVSDTETELSGELSIAPFSPRQLLADLGEPPIDTADPTVLTKFELSGSWFVSGNSAGLRSLTMLIDDTTAKGWLGSRNIEQQAIAMELAIDTINFDRYLPPVEESDAVDSESPAEELPLDDLRALNIPSAQLTVAQMAFTELELENVEVKLTARDGRIRLHPLTASLYDGGYDGDIRINVTGSVPRLDLEHSLSGVDAGQLIEARTGQENLSGQLNAQFTGTARGPDTDTLIKNLAGNASVELVDGVYQGVDLWHEIRDRRARLTGGTPPPAPADPHTDISEFSGTGTFADGVMHNDDFKMKIPFLRMNGVGDLDMLESTVDYRLNAQVVGAPRFDDGEVLDDLEGLILPIVVTGPADAPDISVDFAALAASIANKKLQDSLQKKLLGDTDKQEDSGDDAAAAKDSPRKQLRKSLRKLFD